MEFKKGMICEKMVDDGSYSIGYVDKKPAQWDGVEKLTEGQDFIHSLEGNTFGVNSQDEFIVEENSWIENRYNGPIGPEKLEITHPCQCGSGEERMSCSAPNGWSYCG